jgi:nucleotide-binding universal stress UspA family protein
MKEIKMPIHQAKRVIWAVDPLETDLQIDPATIENLSTLIDENEFVIEPVFVFAPFTDVEYMARDAIKNQFLLRRKIKTLDLKVLINPDHSISSAAQSLIEHAENSHADLIMVSSHGRAGVPHFLFGSFAETLLKMSHLPVLFLNRAHRIQRGELFGRVLWCTDFSVENKLAFDVFRERYKNLVHEIVLYHDLTLPLDLRHAFAHWDAGIPFRTDFFLKQRDRAKEQASLWLKQTNEDGIKGESYVEAGYSTVGTEILTTASEKNVDLIVMVSKCTPLQSVLFGSHAKSVFRANEFPVFVYGPSFCEQLKKDETNKPMRAKLSQISDSNQK